MSRFERSMDYTKSELCRKGTDGLKFANKVLPLPFVKLNLSDEKDNELALLYVARIGLM